MMEKNKEYFVFISYSSLDNEWAIWLRHELEHYHLPASFNGRTDVRDNLRKVFRDRDELSAGPEWDEQVQKALENTNNLIVICSPHSAKSPAVNKEVETFIALGKEDHIFPFIVEGDKPEDCFPPALRHSKLGGDVNKDGGRDSAFIKVVAGMLKVSFPSLWNRYEIEKAEEERKIREHRDKLLIMQSRFLAEKANALSEKGQKRVATLLALEALPKNFVLPDKPFVHEAGSALIKCIQTRNSIINKPATIAIFSPNGKIIATASDDTIHIWDASSQKCIKTIERRGFSVNAISFNHNGVFLASAYTDNRPFSKDNSIYIWDTTSGLAKQILKGHVEKVNDIAFVATKNLLISVSDDHTIRVWDVKSGRTAKMFNNDYEAGNIEKPLVGTTFATSGRFRFGIHIWDIKDGKEIKQLGRLKGDGPIPTDIDRLSMEILNMNLAPICSFSYSQDGKLMAALAPKTIYVWNVETGELLKELKPNIHYCDLGKVVFSPDGKFIAYCSSLDKGIFILDVKEERIIHYMNDLSHGYYDVSFSPDGKRILCAGGDFVHIKELSDKRFHDMLKGLPTTVYDACYSHNGKIIAVLFPNGIIWIIDGTTYTIISELKGLNGHGHTGGYSRPSFNSDDNYVICSSNTECCVWDVKTGMKEFEATGETSEIIDSGFGKKSNHYFYTIFNDGTIKIWDIPSCKTIYTEYTELFPSPERKFKERLDNTFSSFPLSKFPIEKQESAKKLLMEKHLEQQKIVSACCNMEKMIAAIYKKGGKIIIWDMKSKQILHTIEVECASFSFNPDATQLAVGESSHIHIWDVRSWKPIKLLEGNVYSITFSQDGSKIAAKAKNSVMVWDIKSGLKLQEISGMSNELYSVNHDEDMEINRHLLDVRSVAFSPDGNYIITSSADKSIIKWHSPSLEQLISEAREEFKNNELTPKERKKYYLD